MSKKFLVSEEEKSRILNLHNNFDFKKLIKESKENNLLLENDLNEKGQYFVKGDGLKIQVHKDKTVLPVKKGTMIYGDQNVQNVISFYLTNVEFQTTTGGKFYQNVYADIKCDNVDNFVSLRPKRKNGIGVQVKSGFFMNPNERVPNYLRSMFCCGNTLKPFEKRKNGKSDKNWRNCSGGSDKKCSSEEIKKCQTQGTKVTNDSYIHYFNKGGKCYAGQASDRHPGFPTLERCNKCCSGQTPIPPVVSQCPDGVKPCVQYTDCTSTDMTTDGTGNKITMCNKCESVKRLQGCLGVKQDGLWGCKTESALRSKYPEMNGQTGLTKEEIDKICTKVAD